MRCYRACHKPSRRHRLWQGCGESKRKLSLCWPHLLSPKLVFNSGPVFAQILLFVCVFLLVGLFAGSGQPALFAGTHVSLRESHAKVSYISCFLVHQLEDANSQIFILHPPLSMHEVSTVCRAGQSLPCLSGRLHSKLFESGWMCRFARVD